MLPIPDTGPDDFMSEKDLAGGSELKTIKDNRIWISGIYLAGYLFCASGCSISDSSVNTGPGYSTTKGCRQVTGNRIDSIK